MEKYKTAVKKIFKLKIIATTWKDGFEFTNDSHSVSYIEEYIEYIIKKHRTLPTNPTINIYINKINSRLVFKLKDGYKVELHTPETMKLRGSTKKIS